MPPGKDINNKFEVPLVKWRVRGTKGPRTRENCERWDVIREVSRGDAEAIKYIYPWY